MEKKISHFYWEMDLRKALQEYIEDETRNPDHIILMIVRIIEAEKIWTK